MKRSGIFRLILLGSFISGTLLSQSFSNIKFENISIKNGLSQSSPNCIIQDSRGILWIGTEDGLNKYDGYQFTVYKPEQGNPHSVSNSRIKCLLEDHKGNIWTGTNGSGLDKYNRETNSFTRYGLPDSNYIQSSIITSLVQTSRDELYVGTMGGLYRFNPADGKIIPFVNDPADENSLSGDAVTCLFYDKTGNLWIGTENGLNYYDPVHNTFTRYFHREDDPTTLSDNMIRCIFMDKQQSFWICTGKGLDLFSKEKNSFDHIPLPEDGTGMKNYVINNIEEDNEKNLWIATNGGGVDIYNKENGNFYNIRYRHNNPYSLGTNEVLSVFRDNSGIIWVGANGLDKYNPKKEKFVLFDYVPFSDDNMVYRHIHSIYEDDNKVLWIGSKSDGVHILDRQGKKSYRLVSDENNENSLSSNKIRIIREFPIGTIWVGTDDNGLNRIVLNENRRPVEFTHFRNNPLNAGTLTSNTIYSLYFDGDGMVWIGTDNGISKLNPLTNEITRYPADPDDPSALNNEVAYYLFGDSKKRIWVATEKGINLYNPQTDGFIHYLTNETDTNTISSNEILTITEDRDGKLWVGTYAHGINLFDPDKQKVDRFSDIASLNTSVVYGILPDENGYLWLSTNNGILKFDPKKRSFKQFYLDDGLQSNEFNGGAYFKSKSGEIFFGGQFGFNAFYPEQVKIDSVKPKIILTELKVNNLVVIHGENSPIKKHISEVKEIVFDYSENNFSIAFAALHYANPENNSYKYKLEGFDKEWVEAGKQRSVSYTRLPYKSYILRIQASNSDGVWNEEGLAVKIRVKPPFWATLWFKLLALTTIILTAWRFFLNKINREEKQKEKLRKEIDKHVAELESARKQMEKQREEITIQKQEIKLREKEQQDIMWFNEGLSKFSDIMSKNRGNTQKLLQVVISELVNYVEAEQGGIFIVNDDFEDEVYLELLSSYAFPEDRLSCRFLVGEGYIGTCFNEKKVIEVDNIKTKYTSLKSGLGEEKLKYLVFIPLKIDELISGVIELASFKKLKGYRISFVQKMGESLTSIISAEKATEKMMKLVEQSRIQAEELSSQEEELRQSLEEMMATQEESNRREEELVKQAEEFASQEVLLQEELEQMKNENKELKKRLDNSKN